ncbi:hypothetical protein BU24DRAFT_411258 [Aaosphaeria arxii CBS 175.79]|uniref:Fe2OG dioxygenase domain-containing protein n=1 Tax=Aaosphaeria arxii CBS 175.79 TaxID=1450172 RepID=A0A6A5XL42_9PLEO|nr:uncharacterized protein BU24DRAFT_411258 [Aaosphaeria arxii CBS 175.79]KAF2013527.1 hypothetical protein BU24DRAFT_411258 [Aaosphaeria arxii CBS 175.79]
MDVKDEVRPRDPNTINKNPRSHYRLPISSVALLVTVSAVLGTGVLNQFLPVQFPPIFNTWNDISSTNTNSSTSHDNLLNDTTPFTTFTPLTTCTPNHTYTTTIISTSPLVIYITSFLTPLESTSLIHLGASLFTPSHISTPSGNIPVHGRTSTSAGLPLTSPLVTCLLSRARTFMGPLLPPSSPFSTPQLVRYHPTQKFDLHTDHWPTHQVLRAPGDPNSGRLYNRPASFFVFLRADALEGGETWFPDVRPLTNASALREVYGDTVVPGEDVGVEGGVAFKPVVGNAVFWVNVDGEGVGDERVRHAGLPVRRGEKIGLNIWPRRWFGWEDGEDGEGGRGKERKRGVLV